MDSMEVPQYFICPISLQIMSDPVTTVTGITYDRASIEKWLLSNGRSPACPVTNQQLPADSDLTPNHTLRRLIQSWCAANGVDRIPTPKAPLDRAQAAKLLPELSPERVQPGSFKKLIALSQESERNRRSMEAAGLPAAAVSFIVKQWRDNRMVGIEEALEFVHILDVPPDRLAPLLIENSDFIESVTWVLNGQNHRPKIRSVLILNTVLEAARMESLGRLKVDFFRGVIGVVRDRPSRAAVEAALTILMAACPGSTNRAKIVEAGGVFELLELELMKPEKSVSELILGILDHLCQCADGRARLLDHAAGVAVVSKRILRVSRAADEAAVRILTAVCAFSATNEVLQEMLRVGAVSKLCMVLQADSDSQAKQKVRAALRMHSRAWNESPCVAVYVLTPYH